MYFNYLILTYFIFKYCFKSTLFYFDVNIDLNLKWIIEMPV